MVIPYAYITMVSESTHYYMKIPVPGVGYLPEVTGQRGL